jgi:ribosome-binding protein aMBF1 (putative translation factor)
MLSVSSILQSDKMSFRGDELKENERMSSYFDGQDWTEVKIRGKSKPSSSTTTVQNHSPNIRKSSEGSHMYKLENSTDIIKPKKLTAESKQAIVTFRSTKSWTQQQLNQECRFPVNTIREIEAGRLTPSIQQLNMLNRVLKTGLRLE